MSAAKDWEARLQHGLRMWRNLQDSATPVEEWVQEAEDVISLQGEPPAQLMEKHKVIHLGFNMMI